MVWSRGAACCAPTFISAASCPQLRWRIRPQSRVAPNHITRKNGRYPRAPTELSGRGATGVWGVERSRVGVGAQHAAPVHSFAAHPAPQLRLAHPDPVMRCPEPSPAQTARYPRQIGYAPPPGDHSMSGWKDRGIPASACTGGRSGCVAMTIPVLARTSLPSVRALTFLGVCGPPK